MEPEFIITDNHPCVNGWTPRELANAAVVPLRNMMDRARRDRERVDYPRILAGPIGAPSRE
jgi:hypothetical protein